MSIFFKEYNFHSAINGELKLRRLFGGEWFLKIPEGETYSGTYLGAMWKKVLKQYKKIKPENILILGVGAGSAVRVIHQLWPRAFIDALDYDETIIEVGKQIHGGFKNYNLNFIVSDAASFVKKCEKKYDLIVVDIFFKNKPSPLLKEKNFISEIYRILKSSGFAAVNIATKLSGYDNEIVKSWNEIFLESELIGHLSNRLIAVRKSEIPRDYYNIFQSRQWSQMAQKKGLAVAGRERAYFYVQRLPFGLGVVSATHTDEEPDIRVIRQSGCRHGIIFWSQWERRLASRPWKKCLLPFHQKGNGLAIVSPDYQQKWSQMARRNLKKFQSFAVGIKSVNAETFIRGLKYSTLKPSLRDGFIDMINKMDKDSIEFFAAQIPAMNAGREDGKIIGGLAVVNYGPARAAHGSCTNLQNSYLPADATHQALQAGESCEKLGFLKCGSVSAHFVAYLTREGQKCQVGVGLVDWWYKYALSRQIKYLNFGYVRQKWEPWSWQGYSDFKRKFIDKEIRLANGWWRFF